MNKTFTFNRPRMFFLYIPLFILMGLGIFGFVREQNLFVLVAILISLLFLAPGLYMSFFRKMKIKGTLFFWKTPFVRHQIQLDEIRHYGVIKYRKFRFIYISKAGKQPFMEENSYVISDPETFVIQFRPRAWGTIMGIIKERFPDLKPGALEKPQ